MAPGCTEHILVATTPAEVATATGKAAAEDMRAAQLSGDLRLEAAYLNSPARFDSPLVPRTPHAAHSNGSQAAIAAAGAGAAASAAPEQAVNQADSAAAAAAQGNAAAELVLNWTCCEPLVGPWCFVHAKFGQSVPELKCPRRLEKL